MAYGEFYVEHQGWARWPKTLIMCRKRGHEIIERRIYVPERTCKPLGTIRYDYEGGYAGYEYETELSCGHKWRDAYGDYPDYCPYCGRKVES